jgi:SAM-dependent methyltransferase
MIEKLAGPAAERRACVACRSAATDVAESIARSTLVDAWQREDRANNAGDLARRRAEALESLLPPTIRFHRCRRCGLEMADPPSVWPAAAYPRDQSYPARWEFRRALDDLGSAPVDLLEIGCGPGAFLDAARARGHRAVGIDFNDAAVAEARARGLSAFCGGFDELARHLPAGCFDAFVCFHVIEHVPDPDELLSALRGWARPGARLFLSCPGPRRFTRLIAAQQAGRSDFWDYPPQHVLRWTLPALLALLTRHGCRIDAAMEEPFAWVAAASQIGVAQSLHARHVDHPVRRRISIASAYGRLLMHPQRRAGVSLYVSATLDGARA